MYSGYAFAHIDLDTDLWHKIQSLPKVSRFIGEQKTPTPLSEADIQNILDKIKLIGTGPSSLYFIEQEIEKISAQAHSSQPEEQ